MVVAVVAVGLSDNDADQENSGRLVELLPLLCDGQGRGGGGGGGGGDGLCLMVVIAASVLIMIIAIELLY